MNQQNINITKSKNVKIQKISQNISSESKIDFEKLRDELSYLREKLTEKASTIEQLESIKAISQAEKAASEKNESSLLEHLKKTGKWVLDTAKDIGAKILTDLIKSQLGL